VAQVAHVYRACLQGASTLFGVGWLRRMMDGQVPWRCLVPADAVAFIIGKGGANIREMSESSGAKVAVSKEGETPSTLADKIVTIGGMVEQKESACAQVLRKLRQMQGVNEHEPGVFVIIVPQISAPVIIGSKGAQIKAIMEQSGAEINVGREAIIGMPDQPISINGTMEQVVSATSRLNGVLQDMADRGKLMDKDFVFRSHDATPVDHQTPVAEPTLPSAWSSAAVEPSGLDTGSAGFSQPAYTASTCNHPPTVATPGPNNPPGPAGAVSTGSNSHHVGTASNCNTAGNAPSDRLSGGTSFGSGTLSVNGPSAPPSASNNTGAAASFGSSGQLAGCTQAGSHQGGCNFGSPSAVAAFGNPGMGVGGMSMGGMALGMGSSMGVHNVGLGVSGLNSAVGMGGVGMGLGMNSMGGVGTAMMGAGLGSNPLVGSSMAGSSNERAFLAALQASGINSAQLTLLLPQHLVQNILVPRGMMAEIAQRSGSQIDLGNESPPGMRQVTLNGTMVANALASLFLQERAIQFQQMT